MEKIEKRFNAHMGTCVGERMGRGGKEENLPLLPLTHAHAHIRGNSGDQSR